MSSRGHEQPPWPPWETQGCPWEPWHVTESYGREPWHDPWRTGHQSETHWPCCGQPPWETELALWHAHVEWARCHDRWQIGHQSPNLPPEPSHPPPRPDLQPDIRVDNIGEVTNKAIDEFFWQAGIKTHQVEQINRGSNIFAHVWLENPVMLQQALGLNGTMLQGQVVLVQDFRTVMPPGSATSPAATLASHAQGWAKGKGWAKGPYPAGAPAASSNPQEGKGKVWAKGPYPAGAPAASSMSWQQPPREKQQGGEAPPPERGREQEKDHGGQGRPNPYEVKAEAITKPTVSSGPPEPERPGTTAVYCPECQTWLNGPRQWEDHKIGKKHRKNVQKQRAGSAAPKQQAACSSASSKKLNEPIVAPPERGETEGKGEMADWLNAGTDELVKSQVRGVVAEEKPTRSRRSRHKKARQEKDGDEETGTKEPDPESQAHLEDDIKKLVLSLVQKAVKGTEVDVEAPPALEEICPGELPTVPAA